MAIYRNRIVIKIGTSTLMNETGRADLRGIEKLIRAIADIHGMGYQIIIVSSGAIAFGANKLGLPEIPDDMRMKLATAAVGQCSLLHLYDKLFEEYDKTVAQVLMGADDANSEEACANLTSTFNTLLQMGVIPIVNENDSVNTFEIESTGRVFGDNDMLSAVVTKLTKAGKLIILSDRAELDGKGSRRGNGGAKTKKAAAEFASQSGADAHIISGKDPELLYDVINGNNPGTYFPGKKA